MQGQNFEYTRVCEAHQRFTGKQVQITDSNLLKMSLTVTRPDGTKFVEKYVANTPMLVIGNIMIGERFAEPQGACRFTNESTGEVADVNYKPRGLWSTKESEKNFASAELRNKDGVLKYVVEGKYTSVIQATNTETGQTSDVYKAPSFPPGP